LSALVQVVEVTDDVDVAIGGLFGDGAVFNRASSVR
jgi:hypothetical protein